MEASRYEPGEPPSGDRWCGLCCQAHPPGDPSYACAEDGEAEDAEVEESGGRDAPCLVPWCLGGCGHWHVWDMEADDE